LNPSAWASISVAVQDDQVARVGSIMAPAFQQAINDERAEIDRHLTERAKDIASEFTKTT
jgi:hypothetical protein